MQVENALTTPDDFELFGETIAPLTAVVVATVVVGATVVLATVVGGAVVATVVAGEAVVVVASVGGTVVVSTAPSLQAVAARATAANKIGHRDLCIVSSSVSCH